MGLIYRLVMKESNLPNNAESPSNTFVQKIAQKNRVK